MTRVVSEGGSLLPVDHVLPHGVGVSERVLLVEIVLRLDEGLGNRQVGLGSRYAALAAVDAGLHQVVVNAIRHHRVLFVVRVVQHKSPHPPGSGLRLTYQ